jgi:hypothetical protein
MFIAASARPRTSLRRSETRQRISRGMQKAIALLRSFGVRKNRQAINISPLWGERQNNVLLRPQLEFAFAMSGRFEAIVGSLVDK